MSKPAREAPSSRSINAKTIDHRRHRVDHDHGLAAEAGVEVIGLASGSDELLVKSFGARHFVPRGDDTAQRVRTLVPGRVDAVADGVVLLGRIAGAIRDGGQIAVVRPWTEDPGRGISIRQVNVRERATDHAAITKLAQQTDDGTLAARVAEVLPAAQAPQAHRLLEQGGLRGRVVLEF